MCVECLFSPSACAKKATYSDPPPVVPDPESIAAQAAYAETLLPGSAQRGSGPLDFGDASSW